MEKYQANRHDIRNTGYSWKVLRLIAFGIGGVALAALFALVLGFVVQLLWNWLMPDIFALKQISYWQAFGLVFLFRLLFGGFGHHGSRHPHGLTKNVDKWKKYKHVWREKGEQATDDLINRTETNDFNH